MPTGKSELTISLVNVSKILEPTASRVSLILLVLFLVNCSTISASGASQVAKLLDGYPTWSPDSKKIAFVSIRSGSDDIWLVNIDGGGLTNLTGDHPGVDTAPRWSPDGEWIAFESDRAGKDNYDVWIMKPDGTDLRNLTVNNSGLDGTPRWSPNGQYLAYLSERSGKSDVMLVDLSTSSITNLTNFDTLSYASQLSWSNDNKFLVFNWVSKEKAGLWITSVDGSQATPLTDDRSDNFPNWSPIDQTITFHSRRTGNLDIWSIEADGSEIRNLTLANTHLDGAPVWSPDGKQIIYTSGGSDGPDITVMEASGRNKINITQNVVRGANPVWSPDHKYIAFESRGDGNSAIWIIHPDGSNPVNLTGST